MKRIGVMVLAVMLAGCVTPSTMLVNEQGQTMRCASAGSGLIGMAVATQAQDRCASDLRKVGYVEITDAWWGVNFEGKWKDTPLRIRSVEPGSPADEGGMRGGDVVTALDDRPVSNAWEAVTALSTSKPGDALRVSLRRDGKPLDVVCALRAR